MVQQVLHPAAGGVQRHPGGGDALLEQRLAGPVERRCRRRCARRPRAWRPSRSSPCTAGRHGRTSGRRGTRRCRRTRSRSSRSTRRPPAPARRRGGGAHRRLPRRVHRVLLPPRRIRAPRRTGGGPLRSSSGWCTWRRARRPTLTIEAPGGDQFAGSLGGDDVARRQWDAQVQRGDGLDGVEHLQLVAVGGVDRPGRRPRPRPAPGPWPPRRR